MVYSLVDKRINFYSHILIFYYLNLSHPLSIKEFHRKYVLVPAANNVVVVCRLHYVNTLKQGLDGTYQETNTDGMSAVNAHLNKLSVLKVFCLCQVRPNIL